MNKNKARINRFNSFELNDSDQETITCLKDIIFELQSFFPSKAEDFTVIDKLVEESIEKVSQSSQNDDTFQSIPFYELPFIAQCRLGIKCLEILKNVRSVMKINQTSSEITNWDLLVKNGFKVDHYQSFIYSLMKLIDVNADDRINRDLAYNAGRTYVCLLTLPGAKQYRVWNEDLLTTFFKLFTFHEQFKNNSSFSDYEDHYLDNQIMQMLDECKNAFNIVCLSDQEDVLQSYIETISSTLDHFMTASRPSSDEIITKCYENLEALCLKPLPDKEIENIMYVIFCRTVDLHFLTQKRSNRKAAKHGALISDIQSISDFFLYLLVSYDKTKNVLTKFIKSLLSNLDHNFERDKYQKLIDVAVKYELAIYWKSNESIVDYLEKLALASDHRQRLNGVEFAGQMLLVDSTADPSEQTMRIEIPRETFIIKILFEKIYDKIDSVKLKALTSLKLAIINGNEHSKNVFNVIFNQKATGDNPEIVEVLGVEAEIFSNNLLSLLQTSPSTYIRKTCLEILAQICGSLVDNEIFLDTLKSMTDDASYLVKVQLLEIVKTLVVNHSTNNNAIELWLDVILNLIRDNDNKIVEASIKALTAVFQNIESFENTVSEEQLMPWRLMKLIVTKGKRSVLQSAISSATTNFLSQDKLRKIETHIFTANKSEAWCLLAIVAKRLKSNNPDMIVKTFLDQMDNMIQNYDDPSNDSSDFHLILEVIQHWATSFNSNSKAQIVAKLCQTLKNGSCSISMVNRIYEICTTMRTIVSGKESTLSFTKQLNEISLTYILEHAEEFEGSTNVEKMLCFMLIYNETNTDLPKRPDSKVTGFILNFVRKVLNERLKANSENDVPRKLNCCIIILTRFAVRDNELAAELTPDLAKLLKKEKMHISVIKTSIQCLNDLCKKYTAVVTPVFKEIIYKLHSQNEEIRLCALANIYDLVMQDFIKMKGRVLLNFLACLVDKNELIQIKSQAAILTYTNDKNQNLLYTCFLESVFLFNDFIQTENFGVFPLDEIDRNHRLLYGPENREIRHELYSFFVQNIHDLNEVHLLMLLKQIVIIKEKLEKKKYKKHENGVETFKDLLHIFKLICEKRGESKVNVTKADNAERDNEDLDEMAQTSSAPQQKSRKKNKTLVTINDALPVIEKMILIFPSFASLMKDYDNQLEPGILELTKSIAQNFPTFIEYSKQSSFWSQTKPSTKTKSYKRQKTSKKSKDLAHDTSDSE